MTKSVEKKKQILRYSDAELSMIKNTFADNEEVLFALRKAFLQMPLDIIDIELLKGSFKGKKDLMSLLAKTFKPELDPKAPLHQLIDLWLTIDIKDREINELMPVFQARELLIELLDQQLKFIENIANEEDEAVRINITELSKLKDKTAEQFFVDIMARNTLITHVDTNLAQLSLLAGTKEETPEQTLERLKRDSTK